MMMNNGEYKTAGEAVQLDRRVMTLWREYE